MLTALRLGNFKAFGPTQRLPIKPITLIFGPNSAGKSSLIHGLLLAHEASSTGHFDVVRPAIGNDSADLGGFRQFVFKHQTERVVELALELDVAPLGGRAAELFAMVKSLVVDLRLALGHRDTDAGPLPVGEAFLQSVDLLADGEPLMSLGRRPGGQFRIDRVNIDQGVIQQAVRGVLAFHTSTDTLSEEDLGSVRSEAGELISRILLVGDGLLPTALERGSQGAASLLSDPMIPVSSGARGGDLAKAVRMFFPRYLLELLREVGAAAAAELARLHYLGPLRSYPPRHLLYVGDEEPDWAGADGGSWGILHREKEVRQRVNSWLGSEWLKTPYELVHESFVGAETASEFADLARELNYSLFFQEAGEDLETLANEFGLVELNEDALEEAEALGEELLERARGGKELNEEVLSIWGAARRMGELVLRDTNSKTIVSHRDVGIGVSQILPVLASAFGLENRLIAVEQPEIHVHPALQAELGDVFIESALTRGNTFLLETHSEHLILRVMRRMRESTDGSLPEGLPSVRPQDVAVLFVEPTKDGSVVREMPLNERGELVKAWPGGFFEEGLRELL